MNGKMVDNMAVPCNNLSISTCEEGLDVCGTATVSYAETVEEDSAKIEGIAHGCAEKVANDTDDSTCQSVKEDVEKLKLPGFKDFKCSTKYCDTDLCNAGNVAQISFSLLAAIVALVGLL
jgi:hypothetical protein